MWNKAQDQIPCYGKNHSFYDEVYHTMLKAVSLGVVHGFNKQDKDPLLQVDVEFSNRLLDALKTHSDCGQR